MNAHVDEKYVRAARELFHNAGANAIDSMALAQWAQSVDEAIRAAETVEEKLRLEHQGILFTRKGEIVAHTVSLRRDWEYGWGPYEVAFEDLEKIGNGSGEVRHRQWITNVGLWHLSEWFGTPIGHARFGELARRPKEYVKDVPDYRSEVQ